MNFHGRRPLFNVGGKKKKRKYGMFRVRVILERGLTAFQLVERNDEIRSIFFYRDSLIWIITWIINLLFFLLLYFYFPFFFFILLFLWVRLDWIGSPPFDFVFRFSVSIYIYIFCFSFVCIDIVIARLWALSLIIEIEIKEIKFYEFKFDEICNV